MKFRVFAGLVLLVSGGLATTASAEVTGVKVIERISPAFGGTSFGDVGPYEYVRGVAYVELDPAAEINRQIINIDKAPLNAAGHVAFDLDFSLIQPVSPEAGNGVLFYDTINRSNSLALGLYNDSTGRDFSQPEAAGNGFLMRRGYTVVQSGWQAPYPLDGAPAMKVGMASRIPVSAKQMVARLPIARKVDGEPIIGLNLEQVIIPLFNRPDEDGYIDLFLTYPSASTKTRDGLLARRYNENETGRTFVYDWAFKDPYQIRFKPPASYQPTDIYEFLYPARDPLVYGLGYASIRDLVSFLKNEDGQTNPFGDRASELKFALGFGASQTGRVIKTFVTEGFNVDGQGRRVLDGIDTHIGGARGNGLNREFSQPGGIFGADQFPFSYASSKDPLSKSEGSLLDNCRKTDSCPLIFHTDTETEIWSSGASLVNSDTTGSQSLQLPPNVRAYMITGSKHGAGGEANLTPFCQLPNNPLDYRPLMRALLVALEQWVTDGVEPPASRFPSLEDGTWVEPAALSFPDLPEGIPYAGQRLPKPTVPTPIDAQYLDYDAAFPRTLGTYPVYVMAVDQDGNGVAGIQLPDIQVPKGTYTGWNPANWRHEGSERRLCTIAGTYIPFARTRQERLATGDPRLSIEERYGSHAEYVDKVREATQKLVSERLLLEEDAAAIGRRAEQSEVGL